MGSFKDVVSLFLLHGFFGFWFNDYHELYDANMV